ncbi:MAG: amino acid ABC transporter permease [Candidatus Puniceispirillales bacterium]|jgi:polar amino acid transport system permease protein|tara:strand:+ start:1648 stop:2310 length:663 start_codon:yes stop_codon:yes gene_type:complete
MAEVFPRLLPPLWVTLKVSFISLFLAFIIGLFFGSLNCISSKFNPINIITRFYVWIVLCTPIIIQIYAAYLLLPKIGIKLDVFWVGVIALTFNSAGYQIEISRASISSIDKGQYEASKTLGMNIFSSMIYIILPQAIKRMLPATANEASHLIKASSILSVIALLELHKAAINLQGNSFKFIELLALQAMIYLPIVLCTSYIANILQKKNQSKSTKIDLIK